MLIEDDKVITSIFFFLVIYHVQIRREE